MKGCPRSAPTQNAEPAVSALRCFGATHGSARRYSAASQFDARRWLEIERRYTRLSPDEGWPLVTRARSRELESATLATSTRSRSAAPARDEAAGSDRFGRERRPLPPRGEV